MRENMSRFGWNRLGMLTLLAASLAASPAAVRASDDEAVAGGTQAAEAWLVLVDKGDYAKSWEAGAEYFKKAVPQEHWLQSMAAVRTPLGKVISRQLTSATYTKQLPGAPDGEYIVIQYATVYENKASATETITPQLAPDGKWRVSGYYIR